MTAGTCSPALARRSWSYRSGTESPKRRTTKETHTLRKIILGLVATAAIAAPIALAAGPANAAGQRCQEAVTVTTTSTTRRRSP